MLDERVELGDLDGVLPLLVLAEAEQVRLVLRPPAVEEQLVLRDDRLAQRLELLRSRGFADDSEPRAVSGTAGAVLDTRPRSGACRCR